MVAGLPATIHHARGLAPRLANEKDLNVMPEFEEKAFEAICDWYSKWSQIPKYVATVSFAAIAFAITIGLKEFGGRDEFGGREFDGISLII